jgi:hypothetical protein
MYGLPEIRKNMAFITLSSQEDKVEMNVAPSAWGYKCALAVEV